jgi:hypothetical protein
MNPAFEAFMMPVVNDFELFAMFLKSRDKTPLTNDKAVLKSKDLFILNQELHYKASYVTEKSLQNAYYELDFFFHLVIAAKLVYIYRQEKDNYLQVNARRMEQFEALTHIEKYFFLLETSWSYINWPRLSESRSWFMIDDSLIRILYVVAASSPGDVLPVIQHRSIEFGKEKVYFPIVSAAIYAFHFLGFYKLTYDTSFKKKPDRYIFPVTELIPTTLGVALASLLLEKRPINLWNISYRRDNNEAEMPLGISEEQFYIEEKKGYLVPNPNPTFEIEPFLKPFLPLFRPDELHESLFPLPKNFAEGTYQFKIALAKDLYRTIATGAHHTLHDLHNAIQAAYKFDNDHLYAFYMDNERYSDDRYESPWSDEGPFADNVKIGELDLYVGQQFLYLFDFGDEWLFRITLLAIDTTDKEPKTPKVIDKEGKNPKQYSGW